MNNETKVFKIKSNLNCLSLNVLCALIFNSCHEFYIGQTGGMFSKRLTLHHQHIFKPHYAIPEVSKHRAVCAQDLSPPFLSAPVPQLSPRCTRGHRERKEELLISIFQPHLNNILIFFLSLHSLCFVYLFLNFIKNIAFPFRSPQKKVKQKCLLKFPLDILSIIIPVRFFSFLYIF